MHLINVISVSLIISSVQLVNSVCNPGTDFKECQERYWLEIDKARKFHHNNIRYATCCGFWKQKTCMIETLYGKCPSHFDRDNYIRDILAPGLPPESECRGYEENSRACSEGRSEGHSRIQLTSCSLVFTVLFLVFIM